MVVEKEVLFAAGGMYLHWRSCGVCGVPLLA